MGAEHAEGSRWENEKSKQGGTREATFCVHQSGKASWRKRAFPHDGIVCLQEPG